MPLEADSLLLDLVLDLVLLLSGCLGSGDGVGVGIVADETLASLLQHLDSRRRETGPEGLVAVRHVLQGVTVWWISKVAKEKRSTGSH